MGTTVRFALRDQVGLRGPEHEITLENPDPHPGALRRLAAEWSKDQKPWPWQHKWERCYISYNGQTISLLFDN